MLLEGNARPAWHGSQCRDRLPVGPACPHERHLADIGAMGSAPGRSLSNAARHLILGRRFGNLFVGLQPPFGYEGDPMRLLFEASFAPTHAFAAFISYLRDGFKADAVLTFSAPMARLNSLPGKQSGCRQMLVPGGPERVLGALPNFYSLCGQQPLRRHDRQAPGGATWSPTDAAHTQAGLYKGPQRAERRAWTVTASRCRMRLPSANALLDLHRDPVPPARSPGRRHRSVLGRFRLRSGIGCDRA